MTQTPERPVRVVKFGGTSLGDAGRMAGTAGIIGQQATEVQLSLIHIYQFGLLTEFSDPATYAAYLAHPLHQSFLAWVLARSFDVIRFDYALTAQTSLREPAAG